MKKYYVYFITPEADSKFVTFGRTFNLGSRWVSYRNQTPDPKIVGLIECKSENDMLSLEYQIRHHDFQGAAHRDEWLYHTPEVKAFYEARTNVNIEEHQNANSNIGAPIGNAQMLRSGGANANENIDSDLMLKNAGNDLMLKNGNGNINSDLMLRNGGVSVLKKKVPKRKSVDSSISASISASISSDLMLKNGGVSISNDLMLKNGNENTTNDTRQRRSEPHHRKGWLQPPFHHTNP